MKPTTDNGQDRRRFFRIVDAVSVRYQLIEPDSDKASDVSAETDKQTEDLISQYNQGIEQALTSLRNTHPETAQLIELLNKKVDLFANLAEFDYRNVENHVQDIEAASLSACGIAFPVNENFAPDTRLTLTLFLKPSNVEVEAEGRVISCHALGGEDDNNYLRVEFTEMHNQGREKLIQHIVLRQGVILKTLREQME